MTPPPDMLHPRMRKRWIVRIEREIEAENESQIVDALLETLVKEAENDGEIEIEIAPVAMFCAPNMH